MQKVKVRLSQCLIKHHAMKMYGITVTSAPPVALPPGNEPGHSLHSRADLADTEKILLPCPLQREINKIKRLGHVSSICMLIAE
jgi:hypothetical protein